MNPYSWMTRSMRAQVLEARGEVGRARAHYERAIGLVPETLHRVREGLRKKLAELPPESS